MISVVIETDKGDDPADIVWPEDSYPIYYGIGDNLIEFTRSRIMPCVTREQITFLKLSGFVIFESAGCTIEDRDGRYIARNTFRICRMYNRR